MLKKNCDNDQLLIDAACMMVENDLMECFIVLLQNVLEQNRQFVDISICFR